MYPGHGAPDLGDPSVPLHHCFFLCNVELAEGHTDVREAPLLQNCIHIGVKYSRLRLPQIKDGLFPHSVQKGCIPVPDGCIDRDHDHRILHDLLPPAEIFSLHQGKVCIPLRKQEAPDSHRGQQHQMLHLVRVSRSQLHGGAASGTPAKHDRLPDFFRLHELCRILCPVHHGVVRVLVTGIPEAHHINGKDMSQVRKLLHQKLKIQGRALVSMDQQQSSAALL